VLASAMINAKPTGFAIQSSVDSHHIYASSYDLASTSFEVTEQAIAVPPAAPFMNDEGIASSTELAQNAYEFVANAYLDAHNQARSQHGARPLVWSDQLAQKAQNWANQCRFQHSSAGENLAAGTGNYGPLNAVKGWMDEMRE